MRPFNIRRHFCRAFCFTQALLCLLLLGFIGGSVPGSVLADTDTKSKVLEGFKKWYESIGSLKANFNQSTFNPVWGQDQKATGELFLKKPGLMRWEYVSPQKDIIIINQEGFFWYVPEDNQVIKKNTKEAFQSMSPMSILGENMEIEKDFEVLGIEEIRGEGEKEDKANKAKTGPIGYAMLLKPKKPQVAVRKIILKVSSQDFSLSAIVVEEQSGGHNRIEFDKLQINPDLGADLFIFTPPFPGIKVITPKDFPSW